MAVTESDLRNAIESINDPDLGKTLGELNAIESIKIGDNIQIGLRLTQPVHFVAKEINELCAEEIRKIIPDREFEILISEKHVSREERKILPNVKNIIAVASGKGGVGKSSIAANIAGALHLSGASVGILDADVYGPSQPTMFGLKDAQLEAMKMPDGRTVAYPIEKYGIKVASMGFVMQKDQAAIVRGPMLAGYFSMLFEQVEWGPLDYLIFDLPPGTGDIQLTLTQKIPLTGAVVVTTPQEISVADVRRSISMFNKVNVQTFGIVENMSYFTPPDMPGKKYYIFGEGGGKSIAEEFNVPFLGEIPLNMAMRDGNDSGHPFVLSNSDTSQALVIKDVSANIVSELRKANAKSEMSAGLEINL